MARSMTGCPKQRTWTCANSWQPCFLPVHVFSTSTPRWLASIHSASSRTTACDRCRLGSYVRWIIRLACGLHTQMASCTQTATVNWPDALSLKILKQSKASL